MSLYKNGRQGYKHVVERIFCVRVGRKFVICYLLFVKFTFFSFFFFFFFFDYSVFKGSICTITNKANSSLLNNLNVTIISIKTI